MCNSLATHMFVCLTLPSAPYVVCLTLLSAPYMSSACLICFVSHVTVCTLYVVRTLYVVPHVTVCTLHVVCTLRVAHLLSHISNDTAHVCCTYAICLANCLLCLCPLPCNLYVLCHTCTTTGVMRRERDREGPTGPTGPTCPPSR